MGRWSRQRLRTELRDATELVLAPGVTRKLVFHPLQPGGYKVFDEFHLETGQGLIIAK